MITLQRAGTLLLSKHLFWVLRGVWHCVCVVLPAIWLTGARWEILAAASLFQRGMISDDWPGLRGLMG
jgi:hypothetical protein